MASTDTSAAGAGAGGESATKAPAIRTTATPDGQDISDNCAFCSVVGGVLGAGAGVVTGLVFGAVDNFPITARDMSARQKLAYTAIHMRRRSVSDAKLFALMGLIFVGTECVVKKVRARQDITNKAVAGCVTGGALAARGGPTASCIGCVGLSAMAVAVEKFLHRGA